MFNQNLRDFCSDFEAPEIEGYQEAERQDFVARFPIDSLKNLEVDDYVLGSSKDSFCYWLEYKPIVFNIRGGGPALKHGIYKGAKQGRYWTKAKIGKRELTGSEIATVFTAVKNGIVETLSKVETGQVEAIRKEDFLLNERPMLKILAIYYPDAFVTVAQADILMACAKELGVATEEKSLIALNYACKQALDQLPEVKNWSHYELGEMLRARYQRAVERNYYLLGSKYQRKNTDVFPEMQTRSVICVGFASELNLKEYLHKPHKEIKAFLLSQGEEQNAVTALKHFLSLKAGDRVVIKANGSPKGSQAFLSTVGIAEVTPKDGELYQHEPEGLGHMLHVKFLYPPFYREHALGYGQTLHKLKQQAHIQELFSPPMIDHRDAFTHWLQHNTASQSSNKVSSYLKALDILSDKIGYNLFKSNHRGELERLYQNVLKRQKDANGPYYHEAALKAYLAFLESPQSLTRAEVPMIQHPLNTIFYGPPGTGKTYHTVLRAAEIILGKKIEDYAEAQAIFKAHLHERIGFITFHQNYSYEDFVQGIRPDIAGGSTLNFEKRDGIFKQMADQALYNLQAVEAPEQAKRPFAEVFAEFFEEIIEGSISRKEIPMKKSVFYVTQIGERSIEFSKQTGDSKHTLSINTLQAMYEKGRNESITGGLSIYYEPLLKMLSDQNTKHHAPVQRQNYVLIIDEINRANISRVFGELITLIEPDKRSHGDFPLEVRLPSGDLFQVPSNLYLIGTMNTADKSIALLDIALRRRFTFEAMYPDYTLEQLSTRSTEILQRINERVIETKGHDFQIGHAYFMGTSDLTETMNQKVIPLLMEYYMNSTEDVRDILSHAGLTVDATHWPLRIVDSH